MSQAPDRKNSEQIRGGQQLLLSLVRLSGLLFVVGGALIVFGFFTALDQSVGYVLMVVGLIDLVILPIVLRRMFSKKSDEFLAGNRPDNRDGR